LIVAVVAILATIIVAPMATYASANGDKNTAIGLGVIGACPARKWQDRSRSVGACGAGYAYNQYQNDRDQRTVLGWPQMAVQGARHSFGPRRSFEQ